MTDKKRNTGTIRSEICIRIIATAITVYTTRDNALMATTRNSRSRNTEAARKPGNKKTMAKMNDNLHLSYDVTNRWYFFLVANDVDLCSNAPYPY